MCVASLGKIGPPQLNLPVCQLTAGTLACPLLISEDISHSSRGARRHALGRTDAGRPLHISFTLRGGGELI